jgi:hypothetical protein
MLPGNGAPGRAWGLEVPSGLGRVGWSLFPGSREGKDEDSLLRAPKEGLCYILELEISNSSHYFSNFCPSLSGDHFCKYIFTTVTTFIILVKWFIFSGKMYLF